MRDPRSDALADEGTQQDRVPSRLEKRVYWFILEATIKGAFRGPGIVPFNLERVLEALDVRLRTPTPSTKEPPPLGVQNSL